MRAPVCRKRLEHRTELSHCATADRASAIVHAMFLALRQTGARMEALALEVKTKIAPTAETLNAMLVELRPRSKIP